MMVHGAIGAKLVQGANCDAVVQVAINAAYDQVKHPRRSVDYTADCNAGPQACEQYNSMKLAASGPLPAQSVA